MKIGWRQPSVFNAAGLCAALGLAFCQAGQAEEIGLYENAIDAPHLALIEGARSRVELEIYTLNDFQIRLALIAALRRGVSVRVLQESEPVASACHPFEPATGRDSRECVETKAFIDQIRNMGGTYRPFNRQNLCRSGVECFQHGKLMIVDGRFALLSTGNFDPTSFCSSSDLSIRCNRDFSLVIKNPDYVSALANIFERDLRGDSYDLGRLLDELRVPALSVGPHSRAPLVEFIRAARHSIFFENQYLNDASLASELAAAAGRGVRVKIMLASICSFGRPTNTERRHLLAVSDYFKRNQIEARAFTSAIKIRSRPGYLHAKAFVFDDAAAWVGSVNGSAMAIDENREFGLFFSDKRSINRLSSTLEGDFSSSGSTSLAEDVTCMVKQ